MTSEPFARYPLTAEALDAMLADVGVADRAVLVTLSGSRAYGTDRPDSDFDFRGVFQTPTEDLLRLYQPKDAHVIDGHTLGDCTLYEVQKFVQLAAAANPTILEMLWSPVVRETTVGSLLIATRSAFLSQRVVKTYGGYALQQLRRGQEGTGGTRGVKQWRREKAKLHAIRLMEAGIHVLRTGEVLVRHPDPERLWSYTRLSWEDLEAVFTDLDDELHWEAEQTKLPELPDVGAIDATLLTIRTVAGAV